MIVTNLIWSNVSIIYTITPESSELLKTVHIFFNDEDNLIRIVEYSDGRSTGYSKTFVRPKLKQLTPWGCEFEAEAFNSNKEINEPTREKVVIKATF